MQTVGGKVIILIYSPKCNQQSVFIRFCSKFCQCVCTIKPLGLVVHYQRILGVNVFAIEFIS